MNDSLRRLVSFEMVFDPEDAPFVAGVFVFLCVLIAVFVLFRAVGLPKEHRIGKEFYASEPRRFLITGCGSGLGKQLCRLVVAKGHKVLATDKDFKTLKAVSLREGWHHLDDFEIKPLDVASFTDWESAVRRLEQRFGGVDVLLNAACFHKFSKVQHLTEGEMESCIGFNIKGCVFGTNVVGSFMQSQSSCGSLPNGGHIVNFALAGAGPVLKGTSMSLASGLAVHGFSLCAAKDFFEDGVYLTVVSVNTDLSVFGESENGDIQNIEQRLMNDILVRRPRQVVIAGSFLSRLKVRFLNAFSATRFVYYFEKYKTS